MRYVTKLKKKKKLSKMSKIHAAKLKIKGGSILKN